MDTSIRSRWSAALIVSLIVTVAGCGGKNTMASKSAAAFEEARRKGVPLSGSAHGGHAGGATNDHGTGDHSKMPGMGGSNMSGMDHSKMPGMSGSGMSGMDHSKMAGTSGSSMKGMDHSKMPGMSGSSMGGMDHSKMAGTSESSMKGMDHSKMPGMSGSSMSGMQHGGMTEMPQSAQALPDEPATTLRPDPLDAPAPTSVVDAQRSAEMAGMMASGEHAMMSHGNYVHQDAGRGDAAPAQEMDHSPPTPNKPQGGHENHGAQQGDSGARVPAASPGNVSRRPAKSAASSSSRPSGGVVPQKTARYSCPMHPEVTSATPGSCPKCGMALVRKEAK